MVVLRGCHISVQRSEKHLPDNGLTLFICLYLGMYIVSYSIVKLLLSTVSFVLASVLLTNHIDTTKLVSA